MVKHKIKEDCMEKKWMPGTWAQDKFALSVDILASRQKLVATVKSKNCDSPEEMAANAHLIAAAPELYDALEDCEYWLSAPPTSQRGRERVANVIKRARTIMAKARGENAKQETP